MGGWRVASSDRALLDAPPMLDPSLTQPLGRDLVAVWLAAAPELEHGSVRATELAFVRELLGAQLGIDPSRLALRRDASGKPQLDGPLALSLSHCGSLLALAVARGPVGVDLEAPIPPARADRLLRRYLPADWELLRDAPPPLRAAALLRTWTRAEAAVKAVGGSLLRDLAGVRDPATPDQPDEVVVAGRRCALHDRALATGHQLAIAIALG